MLKVITRSGSAGVETRPVRIDALQLVTSKSTSESATDALKR